MTHAMTQSGHAMPLYPSSLERRIIRAKLDEMQRAAAVVCSFGYDLDDAMDNIRDVMAVVR